MRSSTVPVRRGSGRSSSWELHSRCRAPRKAGLTVVSAVPSAMNTGAPARERDRECCWAFHDRAPQRWRGFVMILSLSLPQLPGHNRKRDDGP